MLRLSGEGKVVAACWLLFFAEWEEDCEFN